MSGGYPCESELFQTVVYVCRSSLHSYAWTSKFISLTPITTAQPVDFDHYVIMYDLSYHLPLCPTYDLSPD